MLEVLDSFSMRGDSRVLQAAERIESTALVDLVEAQPPDRRDSLGLVTDVVGGATLITARRLDTYLVNRVLGLGLERAVTRANLVHITERMRELGASRYLLHVAPHARPAEIESWLDDVGLVRYPRAWWKLVAALPASSAGAARQRSLRSGIVIDELFEAADDVGALMTTAFDFPAESAATFAALAGRPRWRVYRAHDINRPHEAIGAALLFVDDDVAYLAGAATARSHRGRGVQRGLLERRLSDAEALGCRLVVVETGEEMPGEDGPSLRNLERVGLQRVYLRANYAPKGGSRFSG